MESLIEKLANGDLEFLQEDKYSNIFLIEEIRKMKDREEFIRKFLSDDVMRENPYFIFNIIYDIDGFEKETKELLTYVDGYLSNLNTDKFYNLLNNTKWGSKYILDNFDKLIVDRKEQKVEILVKKIYNGDPLKELFISRFLSDSDLHRRALFIKYSVLYFPKEAEILFENIDYIFEYRYIDTEQREIIVKMDQSDVSKIIFTYLHSDFNKNIFEKLKKYLISNYKNNDLAELLVPDSYQGLTEITERAFISNVDQLFQTSRRHQYFIINRYGGFLCKQILDEYNNIMRLSKAYETNGGKSIMCPAINELYSYELGNDLKRIVDQYLSLSKTDQICYISSGSKSSTFRVGDYAIKIGHGKWSRESVVCPRIYLYLKNLEEYFIRETNDEIVANLEVQPYLSKRPYQLSDEQRENFISELEKTGYYTTDLITLKGDGANFGILNDYRDADCDNAELLPESFKAFPLVSHDRDLVYKIDKEYKLIKNKFMRTYY